MRKIITVVIIVKVIGDLQLTSVGSGSLVLFISYRLTGYTEHCMLRSDLQWMLNDSTIELEVGGRSSYFSSS